MLSIPPKRTDRALLTSVWAVVGSTSAKSGRGTAALEKADRCDPAFLAAAPRRLRARSPLVGGELVEKLVGKERAEWATGDVRGHSINSRVGAVSQTIIR